MSFCTKQTHLHIPWVHVGSPIYCPLRDDTMNTHHPWRHFLFSFILRVQKEISSNSLAFILHTSAGFKTFQTNKRELSVGTEGCSGIIDEWALWRMFGECQPQLNVQEFTSKLLKHQTVGRAKLKPVGKETKREHSVIAACWICWVDV